MGIRNMYRPKREKTYTVQKYSTQQHDLNTLHHFSNPYFVPTLALNISEQSMTQLHE
jgi:hypothetical protein